MKKRLIYSIGILSLGLVFSLIFSAGFALAANPPADNVPGPLNVGPSLQAKSGSLRITDGGFRSAGPALFDDIVVVGFDEGDLGTLGNLPVSVGNKKDSSIFARLGKFLGVENTFLKPKKVMADSNPCDSLNCLSYQTCTLMPPDNTPTCITNPVINPPIVKPSCGSADGKDYDTVPTSGLCGAGVSSEVIGSLPYEGYWKWACFGGGEMYNSAGCSANKPAPAHINYLTVNGDSLFNGNIEFTKGLDIPGEFKAGSIATGSIYGATDNNTLQVSGHLSVSGLIKQGGKTIKEFGGTYTELWQLDHTWACDFKNPLGNPANTCSCPDGFTKYQMSEYWKGDATTGSTARMYGCYN